MKLVIHAHALKNESLTQAITGHFDERGGTRLTDRVLYDVGFGPLGAVARALVVRRMLERIFDFRHRTIASLFGS